MTMLGEPTNDIDTGPGVEPPTEDAATLIDMVRGRWGATPEERQRPPPGDDLVPGTTSQTWPWLAQIDQDRGGFYSYEWLENLAGCRTRNADRIHVEWQRREVGEMVLLHWVSGLKVARCEPNRVIALELPHFVMERKMLLGIRSRAEAGA